MSIEEEDELKLFYDYVYWPKEWFDAIVKYCREIGENPLELIEDHKKSYPRRDFQSPLTDIK